MISRKNSDLYTEMALVSSTSGSQAVQYGWEQLKLQQAKRNADQAEQSAQSLQIQARDARNTADRADEKARALGVDANRAQENAGRARQGVAAIQSVGQMQVQVAKVADQVIQKQQSPQPSTPVRSAPVVNTQGQMTGRLVNTTA